MIIEYQSFSFSLEAKDILLLPSYKGSTLRGGFGNAFRKIVCALRKTDCSDCILKEKCVFSYVFETPPPSDTKIMRKYTNAPHPFVIEPPPAKKRAYKPGDEINFGLTLIGKAVDYLPYFIYTFDELGKIGIGKQRGNYDLRTVEVKYPSGNGKKIDLIYSSAKKTLKSFKASALEFEPAFSGASSVSPTIINLNFLTPTRMVYSGKLTINLEFHILIRQLLRRIALLSYFHCGIDPSVIDFKKIIEMAQQVKVKKRALKWYDWERYSAKHDARMKMGGFVGEITFEGNIEPFRPLLSAGEVLHVGRGTSFGLGKYRIN